MCWKKILFLEGSLVELESMKYHIEEHFLSMTHRNTFRVTLNLVDSNKLAKKSSFKSIDIKNLI